jgi:CHAT domain-containing protein
MMAQRKGAKTVIASLWEVDDSSTGMLMADFHQRWMTTPGIAKAEALRMSQVDLLRVDRRSNQTGAGRGVLSADQPKSGSLVPYSHPYYWAPFVLIGNWN